MDIFYTVGVCKAGKIVREFDFVRFDDAVKYFYKLDVLTLYFSYILDDRFHVFLIDDRGEVYRESDFN